MPRHEIRLESLPAEREREIEAELKRVRGAVQVDVRPEDEVVETIADDETRADLEAVLDALGLDVAR